MTMQRDLLKRKEKVNQACVVTPPSGIWFLLIHGDAVYSLQFQTIFLASHCHEIPREAVLWCACPVTHPFVMNMVVEFNSSRAWV